MESYRRDAPVTLHSFNVFEDSPLTTREIHKPLNDNKDSSNDTNVERETYGSPLSSLEELQEQLDGDNDNSGGTERNHGPEQMTVVDSDSGHRNPSRSYIDEALPDLLRSGSPLRRRVSSPVSVTLKQVKKEVELSRQRSLRLKAQVDRLQQQSDSGPGWSQNRQRVTEEVQSIVKLLLPLTDIKDLDLPSKANPLDTALLQLQNVARRLALNQTAQGRNKSEEDTAILQQALRDRDEAIAKKQAMETELLKSKNEMMMLNNQLLEAVQSRLELSVELEAWKDDVQTILHHQLVKQQQEEQAKKSRGFGVLRRSNKPLPPKPSISTVTHDPVSTSRSSSPITLSSITSSPNTGTPRWREKFKRGKTSMQEPAAEFQPQRINREDNFQVVSLD
ncbi:bicaudal-D-related protein 2-like [Paramisgurnus dabryanus]|uniref:bicaudal-D-related protein 2-like n=1 Tax=Paramisgurnus dabryanus TaxID=90735 RepID=UPI0031F47347